jgi:hypothetical protein
MKNGNCVAKRIQSEYYPIDDSSFLLVEQPVLLRRRG